MATMNIKDPRVHEMAHQLAALQGSSATAAVRAALEHELERLRARRTVRWDALAALRTEVRSSSADWLDDEDLYDEEGLPR
ncbi:type II toxin-antitoxin system VapB family antitoxin [Brachybacterium huguangmaarense]